MVPLPGSVANFNSPPIWWQTAYGLAFAIFSAAMTFTVPAVFLRFARSSLWLLDAMRPSAYGIYLLHFIFLIWLQYIVYDPAFPAFVKFAIVFAGTLSMSWGLTVLLRKIPAVSRLSSARFWTGPLHSVRLAKTAWLHRRNVSCSDRVGERSHFEI